MPWLVRLDLPANFCRQRTSLSNSRPRPAIATLVGFCLSLIISSNSDGKTPSTGPRSQTFYQLARKGRRHAWLKVG